MNSKSPVWKFFKKIQDDTKVAMCLLCSKTKSEEDSLVLRHNNTTNLWRHLEDHHNVEYRTLEPHAPDEFKQTTLSLNSNRLFCAGLVPSKISIDFHIADLIITDLQPFSFVEDRAFKAFVKLSHPNYELPGRKYFISLIAKLYEEKRALVLKKIKSADFVVLTTDLWTSLNIEAFKTVTNE
jgi:hypothetical protein